MSEIEAIISVKNDLEPGASCCSKLQEYRNSHKNIKKRYLGQMIHISIHLMFFKYGILDIGSRKYQMKAHICE